MKIKYFILTLAILIISTVASAETIAVVDTRIGLYTPATMVTYRESRIAVSIPMLFSVRIVNQVNNGIGLKGELNNYRLGLQSVFDLSFPTGLSVKPFAGFSLSSSDIASNSLSLDFGGDINFDLIPLMGVAIGAEVVTFSDSYMLDYYAGPNFSILPFLSVDVLYSGLLSNNSHRMGFAGRVNFSF